MDVFHRVRAKTFRPYAQSFADNACAASWICCSPPFFTVGHPLLHFVTCGCVLRHPGNDPSQQWLRAGGETKETLAILFVSGCGPDCKHCGADE